MAAVHFKALVFFASIFHGIAQTAVRQCGNQACAVWQKAQSTVWGDFQCPQMNISTLALENGWCVHTLAVHDSLFCTLAIDACKDLCEKTTGCSAVNYEPTASLCDLRRCPRIAGTGLVPTPMVVHQGWNGYALQDYMDSPAVNRLRNVTATIKRTANATVQLVEGSRLNPLNWQLPSGWDSNTDPATGKRYFWKTSDPMSTRTWERPTYKMEVKFRDQHQPEQVAEVRHKPIYYSWLPSMLWLALPSAMGLVLVFRTNICSRKRSLRTSRFQDYGEDADEAVVPLPLHADLEDGQHHPEAYLIVE
jgi:hypothetical protein